MIEDMATLFSRAPYAVAIGTALGGLISYFLLVRPWIEIMRSYFKERE